MKGPIGLLAARIPAAVAWQQALDEAEATGRR